VAPFYLTNPSFKPKNTSKNFIEMKILFVRLKNRRPFLVFFDVGNSSGDIFP